MLFHPPLPGRLLLLAPRQLHPLTRLYTTTNNKNNSKGVTHYQDFGTIRHETMVLVEKGYRMEQRRVVLLLRSTSNHLHRMEVHRKHLDGSYHRRRYHHVLLQQQQQQLQPPLYHRITGLRRLRLLLPPQHHSSVHLVSEANLCTVTLPNC